MTGTVIDAITRLQERILREPPLNVRLVKRDELALDSLVRHPDRIAPSNYLIRNARADASKAIKRRQRIRDFTLATNLPPDEDGEVLSLDELAEDTSGDDDEAHLRIEIEDWLISAPLNPNDKVLLRLAMDGLEAEHIAQLQGEPLKATRVRLSRARARARMLWAAA